MARRCWKHSRQKTGRPWVGRKGTVVSLPHCEQLVLVSARIGELPPPPPPPPSARLALQALQRLGSFLKPLSAKNICSPAVKTNSAPQSAHFRTLSWYSIRCSETLLGQDRQRYSPSQTMQGHPEDACASRWPTGTKLLGKTQVMTRSPNPALAFASSGDAYAKGLP